MGQRPFWLAQALGIGEAGGDAGPAPALEESTSADVCIVGGGFTGLWTAILAKKAKPELDVVLIEADICGAGASGRNGGCALTWSTKFFTLQRLFGPAEAVRLVRASEQAVLDIGTFCKEHGVDCEWRHDGTLFTATSRAQMGVSDAVVAALEAQGIRSWERVPLNELQRRAGSRAHLEGWYSEKAATVQPGKLVRGLRRVALALGVRVHEHTPMSALGDGSPPVVRTPHGQVRARRVVIAINAWMASTFREFERSVAIVSSDMIITDAAPQRLAASGLDGGVSVLDSRIFVHYYRSTADGRLMFGKGGNTFAYGGRMLPVFNQPSPYREDLAERLVRFMPELMGVPIASSWNGASDRSVTGLPFFGCLRGRPDVFYGFGYSGNGVAPSRMGGELLSSLALGLDNEWTRSPLFRGPRGQFPPEPVRFIGSIVVRNAVRRKESAEDRGTKPFPWDVQLARFAAAAGKADKA